MIADDPLQRGTPAGSLRYFAVLYAPPAARPLLHALYSFEAEVRDTVRASSQKLPIRACSGGARRSTACWAAGPSTR